MRELLITKTVGTIQAYTNQAAPVKVRSLFSLGFNTQQLYTSFPVLSSDKFNVSNFTKKSYIFTAWPAQRVYMLHSLAQFTSKHSTDRHRKSSCYFHNLVSYTDIHCSARFLPCLPFGLCIKRITSPKTPCPNAQSELSQLAQLGCYLALPRLSISFMNNGLPISIS